jgi:PAS domain S-box-containing protein
MDENFRHSEKQFKKLIEQNPDGMVLVDREGVVQFANPAMKSFTGLDIEELIGTHFGFPLLSSKTAEIDLYHRRKHPISKYWPSQATTPKRTRKES